MEETTSREALFARALREIRTLAFDKTEKGGDDFYSGASKFIRAWLIADEALEEYNE